VEGLEHDMFIIILVILKESGELERKPVKGEKDARIKG
jgi:hypothetical protein